VDAHSQALVVFFIAREKPKADDVRPSTRIVVRGARKKHPVYMITPNRARHFCFHRMDYHSAVTAWLLFRESNRNWLQQTCTSSHMSGEFNSKRKCRDPTRQTTRFLM
jgi:hypothetical protein